MNNQVSVLPRIPQLRVTEKRSKFCVAAKQHVKHIPYSVHVVKLVSFFVCLWMPQSFVLLHFSHIPAGGRTFPDLN